MTNTYNQLILLNQGINLTSQNNDQETSFITDNQVPHKQAVYLPARFIKKGIHVCLCVYSTTVNNAHLHPKWQQTPVWKVPQGEEGCFFGCFFLKLYCGPKMLPAVSHDL